MRIAINTRFLSTKKMEGFGWYTYEIAKRLVENHPEHEFYFFFDRPFDQKFIFGKNVTPVVINPPARHPILQYLWFNFGVTRALRKHKIDLFFSPDGYLSLKTNVPQIHVLHDLNWMYYPQDLPKVNLKYLQYFFPKFAKKSKVTITISESTKQDIINYYHVPKEQIHVIWNGASTAFKPIGTEQQQEVREKYTQGKSYFLFVGALHQRKNLIRLVQAFEQFKQQTNSNTQLLIVGEKMWKNEQFTNAISMEIRSEIQFTGHLQLEELTKVMASAKLFTFVPYFEGFGIPLAEAMRCGTPILAGDKSCLPEIAGPAAEYCDPFDVNDIAQKLIRLDGEERRLQELNILGLERAPIFSWDKAAQEIANVLGL